MPSRTGRSISRRRRMVRALLVLVAQIAIATGPTERHARADAAAATLDAKNAQAAAELRAHADAAMDGGAFADAIASYRASYELSRNAALLYDIGSAYEHLGDYPRALAYLDQFARVAPADLKDRVPRLDQLIETVRAKLAHVVVRCNVPGARVVVRGTWEGTTPLAADVFTMPGPARVEVVADGYRPFRRDLVLAPGTATRIDAFLLDAELLSPHPGAAREGGSLASQWWLWTGLGAVATATATVLVVVLTSHHAPGHQAAAGATAPTGRIGAALLTW
jgi:tetratricopeptide (TPR) repeat protein